MDLNCAFLNIRGLLALADLSTARDPLKKREFRAGHLTVRRLRYRPAVEKMLQRMDARQLFLTSVKGKKLAAENVRRFVKMRIDDVLDAESKGFHLIIEKHFLH
jgi:hypothetical protein